MIIIGRDQSEDAEDAMDVDEEAEDADADADADADSIMDNDDEEEGEDGVPRNPQGMAALTDEQAALAALESNQLLHLRLRKRYYAEALNFIRQVEDAAKIILLLLGSTHKTEVLESMEFYRVAHEYQLDGAKVRSLETHYLRAQLLMTLQEGIKKMLHLIWSKDNSSMSEDGKELKGIRSRLLECYRSLYFDPLPDMEPKQQVNRIAKNMIECVGCCDASLDTHLRLTLG
jgi:condensin complex subunit 1